MFARFALEKSGPLGDNRELRPGGPDFRCVPPEYA